MAENYSNIGKYLFIYFFIYEVNTSQIIQNNCFKEIRELQENTERQFNKIRKMMYEQNEQFNR